MKKYLLCFFISLITNALTAQNFNIEIHLTEKSNHQPVLMANCVLDPLAAASTTDFDGKTVLKNVPEGRYFGIMDKY